MAAPGRLPQRIITAETVEHLRRSGASADLIGFAERHVARYSQADMDRARRNAILSTLLGAGLGALIWHLLGAAI